MRQKIKKITAILQLIVISTFFIFLPAGSALATQVSAEEVIDGSLFYKFSVNDNYWGESGLAISQNASRIDQIYLYFKGYGATTPEAMCGTFKLCADAGRLTNTAILMPTRRSGQGGPYNFTREQLQNYINEATQVIRNIQPNVSATWIVAGHSAGGQAVLSYIRYGLPAVAVLLYDACYTKVCADIIDQNAHNVFIYYGKNSEFTPEHSKEAYNKNPSAINKLVEVNLGHNEIPQQCFMDYTANDNCSGKGKNMAQESVAPAPAETAAEEPAAPAPAAPQKRANKLGKQCFHPSTNEGCEIGDCESSDLKNVAGETLNFCDCNELDPSVFNMKISVKESKSCNEEFGKPEDGGIWKCVDGSNASYDLDTCESTNGMVKFPIPPNPELNAYQMAQDLLLDLSAASKITVSDLKDDMNDNLSIKIPGLNFTKLFKGGDAGDTEDFLFVPWIGEYIAAVYKYAMVAASILAVILIILQGVRILISGGGENQMAGYKRIGQIVIGLFILWGSYAILYNINPSLTIFRPIGVKYVGPIPLDVFDKEPSSSAINPRPITVTDLDALFKSYGNCVSVDWQVLKALASIESGLNPEAVNKKSGYMGLFQTKVKPCEGELKGNPYQLGDYCTEENLTNAEVSTMVGASMMRKSIKTITDHCKNIDGDSLLYFIYTGHHSGLGVLNGARGGVKGILTKTCDYTTALPALHEFWEKYENGTYADSTGRSRTAKIIAEEADRAGKKMIEVVKKLGGGSTLKAENTAQCPLLNASLRFSSKTVGPIPCDNHQNMEKIVNGPGLIISAREPYLTPQTASALRNAGRIAESRGYKLIITGACRDLATQVALAAQNSDRKAVATPGKSNHGFGTGIDVALANNAGKPFFSIGTTGSQCTEDAASNGLHIKELSEIMYEAGFSRYAVENWHFEVPERPGANWCRSRSFTGISSCGVRCPVAP